VDETSQAPASKGWAAIHKRALAFIAAAAAVVGLATGVLTLWNQLFGGDDDSTGKETTQTQQGAVAASAVRQLTDDVQLTEFVDVLGPPLSQKRLQNDEWLLSTWESPDIAVGAFSDRDSQVVAYTVTSLGPDFTPLVEHVPGGVRLRESVFADVETAPAGTAGVYPPNGRYSYEEFFMGGGATDGKSVVLAASYAANADDQAATGILELSGCLPFSVFEAQQGCGSSQVQELRNSLHVTSVTIGSQSALMALSSDGALFFPEPS
jgi:hypothetical protein